MSVIWTRVAAFVCSESMSPRTETVLQTVTPVTCGTIDFKIVRLVTAMESELDTSAIVSNEHVPSQASATLSFKFFLKAITA